MKILICVLRFGNRSDKNHLKFSYTSFAVDSLKSGESKSQMLKCTVRLCHSWSCDENFENNCPDDMGYDFIPV